MDGSPPSGRARLLLAFAVVYVIWGSTYLAILLAIETLPPLLMASIRFLIAGGLLYGWLRLRGAPRPTARQWRSAAVIGLLMLLGGNGALSWAEQRVPSGVAALIIASVPLWMVAIDWVRPSGRNPGLLSWLGIGAGLAGVALLFGPGDLAGEPVDLLGGVLLVAGSASWALGSIYSRHAALPESRFVGAAMQMLAGGVGLGLAGTFLGEWSALDLSAVSLVSVAALAYLILMGSIVAYSAYVWLLANTTPAKVGTYAFVNPIVALALGALFVGEEITVRTLVASALIVVAVALTLLQRAKEGPRAAADREPGTAASPATAPALSGGK